MKQNTKSISADSVEEISIKEFSRLTGWPGTWLPRLAVQEGFQEIRPGVYPWSESLDAAFRVSREPVTGRRKARQAKLKAADNILEATVLMLLEHIRSRLTSLKKMRRLKALEETTRNVWIRLSFIEHAGMIPTEKDVHSAIKLSRRTAERVCRAIAGIDRPARKGV
jgi:hypothetical protein